ncbi:MAG: radical SAM protein [Rhodocyclaceae bacterium]|nr:radical SAM protein [Rhodocyclaceae bacterium]
MPAPHLISWNLTRRCNLACGHCYLDAVQRKSEASDELTLPEVARVIDEIAEFAPGAMLVLTGGEPLLRRDLDDIVEHAAGMGLMPVVGTNGILLDAARAQHLRERGAAGVGISLDSTTPEFHDRLRAHDGAWKGALDGMGAARDAGLGVLMQATLFEENRHQLAGFADLAVEVGAMALNFFFLVCTGRGVTQTDLSGQAYEESLRDILALQQARPNLMIRARCAPYARRMLGLHAGESAPGYAEWSSACLAGRRYLRIGPKGEVTPCPYVPNSAGSVRWQPLREIWETGVDFVRLREEMPGGKCGACDYRVSCGGCRARALATTGDLMNQDGKCNYSPPVSTKPELPSPRCASAVIWSPEAQRLLDRIPGFVRDKVCSNLEQQATVAGEAVISIDFMLAHRPSSMPFGRPAISA